MFHQPIAQLAPAEIDHCLLQCSLLIGRTMSLSDRDAAVLPIRDKCLNMLDPMRGRQVTVCGLGKCSFGRLPLGMS